MHTQGMSWLEESQATSCLRALWCLSTWGLGYKAGVKHGPSTVSLANFSGWMNVAYVPSICVPGTENLEALRQTFALFKGVPLKCCWFLLLCSWEEKESFCSQPDWVKHQPAGRPMESHHCGSQWPSRSSVCHICPWGWGPLVACSRPISRSWQW